MNPTERRRPLVVRAGEGDLVDAFRGDSILIKVEAKHTADAYGLIDYTAQPGSDPLPAHVHDAVDEFWLIQEGRMKFWVEGEIFELEQGDSILAPSGNRHCFWNASAEPARFTAIFSPGGLEQIFRDWSALVEGEAVDGDVFARKASALLAHYGTTSTGPTPGVEIPF